MGDAEMTSPDRTLPCAHLGIDEQSLLPWCQRSHSRHPDRGECRTCPEYGTTEYDRIRRQVWSRIMGDARDAASTGAAGADLATMRAALHRSVAQARHIIRVDRDYDRRESARVRLSLIQRMQGDLDAVAEYCGGDLEGASGG